MSQLLKDMDIDGDGSIIYEEFRHWAIDIAADTAKQILGVFAKTKNDEEEAAFEVAVEIFETLDPEQEGFILGSALEQVPDVSGVMLSTAEVEAMMKELTGREEGSDDKVDMDAFCEWAMGKSKPAAVLTGRDGAIFGRSLLFSDCFVTVLHCFSTVLRLFCD